MTLTEDFREALIALEKAWMDDQGHLEDDIEALKLEIHFMEVVRDRREKK